MAWEAQHSIIMSICHIISFLYGSFIITTHSPVKISLLNQPFYRYTNKVFLLIRNKIRMDMIRFKTKMLWCRYLQHDFRYYNYNFSDRYLYCLAVLPMYINTWTYEMYSCTRRYEWRILVCLCLYRLVKYVWHSRSRNGSLGYKISCCNVCKYKKIPGTSGHSICFSSSVTYGLACS